VRDSRPHDTYKTPGQGRVTKEEAVMTERTKRLSRRNFLLTVGAGGAATAAAIVAKTPGSESPEKDKSKRDTRGYHATEHVNNYYRTTKV
jgi:hypothetical protein